MPETNPQPRLIGIGVLYFVEVFRSTRTIDISECFNNPGINYGQPRLVSADRYDDRGTSPHWIVVEVPSHDNFELRDECDVVAALRPIYRELHRLGLLPNADVPIIDRVLNPFEMLPLPA